MTQTSRPQTPWLVPVGAASDIEHKEFTIACRGHVQIGKVLGYLIVAASWQVKKDGTDIKNCEVVELEDISHKSILAQVKISQNSLTTYIKQLITWGYVTADTYRHTYQVYPQKINEAVAAPPPLLEKKPRGKHAPPKVVSPESQTKIREEKITKLRKKITTLGIQFTNLGNQITTLRNEISNLGIVEPCESTPEQGVMNDSQAGDIIRILRDIKIDSLVISASAESDEGASFLSSLSQFEEILEDIQNGQAPLQMSCIPDRHEEEPVKPAGDSEKPAPSAVHDTTLLQEIPTQDTLLPVVQIQTTKPASPNKTHRKENHKISVLSVPKVPPRVIREAIDAIRGYALDQEGPIKHQGVILKGWCQKHTLEDFQHVIEHLTKGRCSNEKHQWWREKNHMKSFFNAAKLAELTPDILSELGYIPKPEAPPEVAPPVEEPKVVGWTPVRQIYPRNGETVIYG